jgi:DNA-directed RNA polymerase alpha subunit
MSEAAKASAAELRKAAIRLRAMADLLDAEAAVLDGKAAEINAVLDWGDLKVFDSELSNRAKNALGAAGIVYVADLIAMSDAQLQTKPGVGRIVVKEIKSMLRSKTSKRGTLNETPPQAWEAQPAAAGLPRQKAEAVGKLSASGS